MQRTLSIRNILLLVAGGLTLLIALISGWEIYLQWDRLNHIQGLKNASQVSDRLFAATEKLSQERDITATMLRTRDADTTATLQLRLAESRTATDTSMQATLDAFNQYEFSELEELQERIKTSLIEIQTLRGQVDKSLAHSGTKDTALAERWNNEVNGLMQRTQELWVGFIRYFTNIHPAVTQHLRYKHLLRIISDYTGRERAIIGRLIVDNMAPTPKEFAALLHGQGVIDQSWQMSTMLAEQSGLMPGIRSQYTDARSHYQTLYSMVRNIFFMPIAHHGKSYPISADLWLELSAQSNESLDALKKATVEETNRYVEKLAQEAWRDIVLHILVLLVALCLCAYSLRVITHHVMGPINAMIEALMATMQGRTAGADVPVGSRIDEIDKLSRVLQAFKVAGERYRALVESSTQIVWVWKEGTIDKMSPLSKWWEETTGEPSDSIATFGWLEVVHPEDRDRVKKIWEDAISKRQNFDMDYRLRGKSGKYLHVAVRGVVLLNPDGSIREFIGSLNDVTKRKEAEAGLLDYMRALEHSNKELDDFAYIASHDLKEPLRGIHNHSRFLLEDNADKLDKDSVHKLGRLVYLSQRMERLVNDLLYFSRLGRQELAVQPTDLNEVIHDIENTLDVTLAERNGHITIAGTLPTITCDKTRVTELFRNLITNALKYNDKPEKIIEVGSLPAYTTPQGEKLLRVFYVRDNGKGIAPEFHEEIFRIFKRLQSDKDTEEGTGVGLTFVKKIIERHGGKIVLESEPGKGTTFYFTLEVPV